MVQALALVAGAWSFASCSQPPTPCTVGPAGAYPYAVRYTPLGAPPACATSTGFLIQRGDLVGIDAYFRPYAGAVATVALRADTLGQEVKKYRTRSVADPDPTHQPYALGAFAAVNPDADAMCRVIGLELAEQDLSSTPAGSGALPAESIQYVWSNVAFYVTAADQGTQFSGDVVITLDGCSVRYHAVGLWPGVPCDDGHGNALPDLCNPCAEPDVGRFTGSGISPDAKVVCRPILANPDPYGRPTNWCVLDEGEPAVLNPHPPTCD
jgi:hypothetical protein